MSPKIGYLCLALSATLFSATLAMLVWSKESNNGHLFTNHEDGLKSALTKPRNAEIMETLDLSDPRIKYPEATFSFREMIVGIVARELPKIEAGGELVYWYDRSEGTLYCSLVRKNRVVAEVNIPSGWRGYNTHDLTQSLQRQLGT